MFENRYAIKGITNELFENWKNDLRTDILWWEFPGEDVQLRIKLSIIEAIKMKYLISKYNKEQAHCDLKLVKV